MKQHIIDILFSGKRYDGRKIKLLSAEELKFIEDETKNCTSPFIKDRIYWIFHDIKEYKSCKKCGQSIIKHNIKYFDDSFKNQSYCCVKCRMSHDEFHKAARHTLYERTGYKSPIENPETRLKIESTNLKKYGAKNVFQSDQIKDKIKKTSLERYDTSNPTTTDLSKQKRMQTCIERYGVDNPLKVQKFKDAAKQTLLKLYGKDNARKIEIFNIKARSTNLERYGVEYPSHTEKGIVTNLKRYGVRHPMQNFKVFQKVMRSRFKIKKYITESGKVINYQGYEDVVIRFLLEDLNIPESQIITDRKTIPKIFYFNTILNKMSRYYPDIWLKSHNLLIEVKSTFTFNHHVEITLAKQSECKKQGINHIIVICSKTKILDIL